MTISSLWLPRKKASPDPLDHWSISAFSTYELRSKTTFPNPWLALCVKFGLVHYLSSVLSSSPSPITPRFSKSVANEEDGGNGLRDEGEEGAGGQPLLAYAIEFLISRKLSIYPLSTLEMVKVLLEKEGIDPNETYKDFKGRLETPWGRVLKAIREGDRRGWISAYEVDGMGIRRWVEIVDAFIQAGANRGLVLEKTRWEGKMSAMEVLEGVFEGRGNAEVGRLVEMVGGGKER